MVILCVSANCMVRSASLLCRRTNNSKIIPNMGALSFKGLNHCASPCSERVNRSRLSRLQRLVGLIFSVAGTAAGLVLRSQ